MTAAELTRRSETAVRLGLKRNLIPGGGLPLWTPKQLHLLGKKPDEDVARQIGRTVAAVRLKRTRLGILTAKDRRRTSP